MRERRAAAAEAALQPTNEQQIGRLGVEQEKEREEVQGVVGDEEEEEEEDEDEALEVESRALPAYLRRPHGVADSPRHGRAYTFGTHERVHAHAKGRHLPADVVGVEGEDSRGGRGRGYLDSRSRSKAGHTPRQRSVSSVFSSASASSATASLSSATSLSNDRSSSSVSPSNDGVSITDSETEGETETDVLPTPEDEVGDFVFTLGVGVSSFPSLPSHPYAHGHSAWKAGEGYGEEVVDAKAFEERIEHVEVLEPLGLGLGMGMEGEGRFVFGR